MTLHKCIWLLSIILLMVGCEKIDSIFANYNKHTGLIILCEGNYSYGNASFSFYQPDSMKVNNDLYRKTNGDFLGDVAQSMVIRDSIGYIVINNSSKIVVINTNTFKRITTINGLSSPRYMLFISSTKAYVSDLYNKSVSIVNPSTNEITGIISLKKTSEQMIRYGDIVFVNNWSRQNTIQRINCSTDQLIDSVIVTRQPNSMVLDKYNKLWVLSDGGYQGDIAKQTAALTKIDAATFQIEKVYPFPSAKFSPSRLCINGSSDTIYYLSGGWMNSNSENGIYRMSVTDDQLPQTSFISQNKKLFYGLAIDPKTSEVYTSDAVDYLQGGWVFRYKPNAAKIDSFRAGIIPSFFCFK